jgi:hypothetical protein
MSKTYLLNKDWTEITREERYFTAVLFESLRKDIKPFLSLLKRKGINVEPETPEKYEPAFEICFYRDLLFAYDKGIRSSLYPVKRTFDLAIFSENHIILFEAKANQSFSTKQLDDFKKDKRLITQLLHELGKECPKIDLVVIFSDKYTPTDETLPKDDFSRIKWSEIAEKYNDNQAQFLHAKDIYGQ